VHERVTYEDRMIAMRMGDSLRRAAVHLESAVLDGRLLNRDVKAIASMANACKEAALFSRSTRVVNTRATPANRDEVE